LFIQSSNNAISGNNIAANNYYGVRLYRSSKNIFYHNNFRSDNQQIYMSSPDYANFWDDGYPSGGNYWTYRSNYTGVDLDHDGIDDSPHLIDANNTDNYPLMGMFSSYNTSTGYHVNVISNSTIDDFEYFESNSTIKMYVSGEEGFGFCRVSIPHIVMNVSSILVIIDDGLTLVLYHNYTLYDNGTHRWIYFSYEDSIHEIDIIPEFPTFMILPLFMIATLLTVVVYRSNCLKPDSCKQHY